MTTQEIRDNYAKTQDYKDWDDLECDMYGTAKQISKHWTAILMLVQQEQQKLIAENARIIIDDVTDWHKIDKSSIINENNIII